MRCEQGIQWHGLVYGVNKWDLSTKRKDKSYNYDTI